jgi:hypothetical protein
MGILIIIVLVKQRGREKRSLKLMRCERYEYFRNWISSVELAGLVNTT